MKNILTGKACKLLTITLIYGAYKIFMSNFVYSLQFRETYEERK